MNALILTGLILISLGIAIVLCLWTTATCVHCLAMRMPVMQWLTLRDVLALECARTWLTKVGLIALYLVDLLDIRLSDEYEDELLDETQDAQPKEDFSFRNMHRYEYRLRSRLRSEIKVERHACDGGELVPA